MKKAIILFLTIISFSLLFTVAIFAEDAGEAEAYYLVQSEDSDLALSLQAEGKNVVGVANLYGNEGFFATLTADSNINLILAENISYKPSGNITNTPGSSNALRISTNATVTVLFSGYYWWFTSSADGYTGFVLNNQNATLRLIGTKAKNADGTFRNLGGAPDYSVSTPEEKRDLDLYNGYIAVYLGSGNLYIENLASASDEEYIYHKSELAGNGSITIRNSAIGATTQQYGTININHTTPRLTVDVDGGIYDYLGLRCLKGDAVIKNCRLVQSYALWLDGYSGRNTAKIDFENVVVEGSFVCDGDSNLIYARNCSFQSISLKGDSSGGPVAEFYDTTYTSLTMGKASTSLTVYKSATCEECGSKVVYTPANTAGTADTSYALENPALGHKITIETATGVTWDNYFENGMYCGYCSVCNQDTHEVKGSASPLFVSKGLSFAEYEDTTCQVSQGFKVNKEMTKFLDEGFDYGVIATINKGGEEIAPELNGQKVVSASFANVDFEMFYIKLTSIPAAEKDTAIVFCAYLVNGEDKYYLNEGKTSKTIVGLSYNYVSTK